MELLLRLPYSSRVYFTWKIFAVFCLLAISTISASPVKRSLSMPPLGCHLREYTDFVGEKSGCRPQKIKVDACFGFCDTFQVPEIWPPYRVSQHEMCSYGETESVTIELDDCDDGVDRTFTYITAKSCVCRNCIPASTLCFGFE